MSTALEELMHAALAAAPDRRDDALAVLRGQLAAIDPAKTVPPREPYLTLREVGQRLGISSATLWRWQVPGHSLGGRRPILSPSFRRNPKPKAAKAKKGTPAPATDQPAPQPAAAAAKAEKPAKARKAATSEADGESTDRLPTTLDELKETKGGFVAFHFLTGKDKDAIAKDLTAAFKLAEPQAAKIVRRITGRVRLYARVFELVPAKKA